MMPWSPVSMDFEFESNLLEPSGGHGDSNLGDDSRPPPTTTNSASIEFVGSRTEMWLPNPFIEAYVMLADLDMSRSH